MIFFFHHSFVFTRTVDNVLSLLLAGELSLSLALVLLSVEKILKGKHKLGGELNHDFCVLLHP